MFEQNNSQDDSLHIRGYISNSTLQGRRTKSFLFEPIIYLNSGARKDQIAICQRK